MIDKYTTKVTSNTYLKLSHIIITRQLNQVGVTAWLLEMERME